MKMFSVLNCGLIFLVVSFVNSASTVEEFCKDYPGDVSFVYETVTDETTYNFLYGSPVVYKYRKIHKKIIRPYSSRVGSYLNSPVIQQQQIQQKIIPLSNKNLMNNMINQEVQQTNEVNPPEAANHENNTSDDTPLPIWKLHVPRNAIVVTVERIEDGKVVDKFLLDKENFQNKSITTHPSLSYIKSIDVTPNGIVPDGWYAICMSMSISVKKKPSTCQYCTLLKASTTSSDSKALKMKEMPEYSTADSIRLQYEVQDLPFPAASVITKVYLNYEKYARCLSVGEIKSTAESVDPIQADTVVYVDLNGLSEASEYAITTDLVAQWKDDLKRAPLTAHFYLNPSKTQSVAKCSRISY